MSAKMDDEEKLRGHEPKLTWSRSRWTLGCDCGDIGNRPFMWHVLDVLYADREAGA